MQMSSFEEMYTAELQEARSFEEMLTDALPRMAKLANHKELVRAFEDHLEETRTHLDHVSELLRLHNAAPAHRDGSVQAMIREAEKMAEMPPKGPLRDAALIESAQRIEHYEIAVYGTLATFAKGLGRPDDKRILGAILEEEKAADQALTDIATGLVNPQAIAAAA